MIVVICYYTIFVLFILWLVNRVVEPRTDKFLPRLSGASTTAESMKHFLDRVSTRSGPSFPLHLAGRSRASSPLSEKVALGEVFAIFRTTPVVMHRR